MASSVLIAAPVRNREKILPLYLESLESLDFPKDQLSYFFLVNDSKDATEAILKDFSKKVPRVTVERWDLGTPDDVRKADIRTKHVYSALAKLRNKVMQHFERSSATYLLSVDSDIEVRPQLLKRLLSHQKDMVAAMISNRKNRMCPNAICRVRGPYGKMVWERFTPPGVGVYPVDVTGAVCLHSRNVIGCRYGWASEGEDAPFCDQVKAKGLSIWIDTSPLATHHMS